MPVSKPYILRIENTTRGILTANIFGFGVHYCQSNYGNNDGIVITSATSLSYGYLLTQSQNKPFDIEKWRFECSNTIQLDQTMTFYYVDGEGRGCFDPVILANFKKNIKDQSTELDVEYLLKVDGNTWIKIPILGGAVMLLSMWPQEIYG